MEIAAERTAATNGWTKYLSIFDLFSFGPAKNKNENSELVKHHNSIQRVGSWIDKTAIRTFVKYSKNATI